MEAVMLSLERKRMVSERKEKKVKQLEQIEQEHIEQYDLLHTCAEESTPRIVVEADLGRTKEPVRRARWGSFPVSSVLGAAALPQ
jgi:hypothetical protein